MAKASAKVRNFLLIYRQVAVFFILHLYFGYHKSNFSAEIAHKKIRIPQKDTRIFVWYNEKGLFSGQFGNFFLQLQLVAFGIACMFINNFAFFVQNNSIRHF